jgi:subfamily B ATP-binding cassette protein MsbA
VTGEGRRSVSRRTGGALALRARLGYLGRVFAYVQPRFRPHLLRAGLGTLLSVLAAAFGVLSTLAMASLLELLKGRPPAAPPGGLDAWLDLNTMGRQALGQIGRLLGEVESPMAAAWVACALLVSAIVATVLLHMASQWLWMSIRLRLGREMQVDLFAHLLDLPMQFHVRERVGSLMSRLHSDVQGVAFILPTLFDTLVRAPVMLVAFLVLMLRTSVDLTLVTAGAAGLYVLGMIGLGRLARRMAIARSTTAATLMALMQQAFLSVRVVKAFRAERREVERVDAEARRLTGAEFRVHLYEKEIPEAVRRVLGVLTLGLVAIAAAALVSRGQLTQEGMLLFLGAAGGMLYSAGSIGAAVVILYTLSASAGRVLELRNVVSTIVDGPDEADGFRQSLGMRGVRFTYGGGTVLDGISLTIRRGEVVGLVGASGVGKSTLIDLLVRLYDPSEGTLALDGKDIREFTTSSYRRLFGIVSQESFLFHDTIRSNIAYGAPDATDAEVERAARLAQAHEFIVELPRGYDTVIGERGTRLSGGQRQRIAIARAIVHRPPILIFDEATSALDNESERIVQQAIARLTQDSTVIVVAHRLSTVQTADRLVVLDQGRIVQEGSHADLVGEEGVYRRLWEAQFADEESLVPSGGPTRAAGGGSGGTR